MNKKVLVSTIAVAFAAIGATSTASAALVNGSTLNFDAGVAGGNYGFIVSGSFFGMDTNGNGSISKAERTGLSQNDGIVLGTAQLASGSHSGAPGCVNGVDTCNNMGEFPGIDNPWNFFGNTGMHQTSTATNVLSASGNTATVDFSGWTVQWNGGAIDMGSGAWTGNADGQATITCGVDCGDGDTFTLEYSATVPASDPGFGGVQYVVHMEGTVSAVPVPAAVWLFGSGLVGLAGIARRRKTA